MYIILFRNWGPPSNWHQAHDGMLYHKYWRVRSFKNRREKQADKHHRNYVPLVNLIGVFFQIRDDLMNLQSAEVSDHIFTPLFVTFINPAITHASTHQIRVSRKILPKGSSPSQSFMEYMQISLTDRSWVNSIHPLSQPSSQSFCNNSRCPAETPYDAHTQNTHNRLSQERDEVICIHPIRVEKPRGSN